MPTEVKVIHDKTFDTIISAVNKMCDFIRTTYGPAGNKVIISKVPYSMVVDDGVQAARDFELPDPAENAVVRIVREVAVKTNDLVGDGTTSSLIMLQAIMNEVSRRGRRDGRKISLELKRGLEEVRAHLLKIARPIKGEKDLQKVALVSYDNQQIAGMIADLYAKLGKDGVITIDKSPTAETTFEISEGITIERGYLSHYMVTNPERMEAVIEKPHILITDYRLTETTDIIPIMEKMLAAGKHELVIIADNVEGHALATAVVNKLQGKFLVVAISAPSGDNRKVTLEDMALMVGAKVFSEAKGDKLDTVEISDLGRADRFICRREESVIVKPKGNKKEVKKAISELRQAIANEKIEKRRKELVERLAMFTNTIAVIKVGAATENEQKALKYKIEDAVNAVKAAYRGGVVCGGGLSLARIKTSSPLLNEALQYPHRQLLENMGLDPIADIKNGHAFNVVTNKVGPFMEVGVMDPVDVLIAGVESAVSIASILVTSSGMIVESQKQVPSEQSQN